MQAAEDRRRQQEEKQREEEQRKLQLLERQAASYGQVVLDILGDRTTIDELAGRLLDTRDRAAANHELKTEWAAHGAAYFQPNPSGNGQRKSAGANREDGEGAAGSGAAGDGEHLNGHQPPAPQPSRARPTPPPATQDLLGGIAADRAGSGTPAEGGGRGEQP
jgi:hypothetical protein